MAATIATSQMVCARQSVAPAAASSSVRMAMPARAGVPSKVSLKANKSALMRVSRVQQMSARRSFAVKAEAETTTSEPVTYETYEVELQKPIQVKFARGNDGGAYVVNVPEGSEYEMFEIGDKIKRISASFGSDVWEAENYGQVMYALKTRSGDVYFELEKRMGDLAPLTVEKKTAFKAERAGGNYGAGTQEMQIKNYVAKNELAKQREEMFGEALGLYKQEKYDEALMIFENVVGLEPAKYMGDNFQTSTDIYRVSQYNVACCYSQINQLDAGLEALQKCLVSGFDDYKMIRTDPSLANLRTDDSFKPLMDKFDEPFLNENAMKVLNNLFGGFGKK